ncbi:MAG: DUF1641 domain-containing protein [Anaerolineales bacterium]|nr:DUF1641 domain-containing protein [Anaerolineales bacterium]
MTVINGESTPPTAVVDWQTRLNEPHTAAALNRLLDRIDRLEQTVNRLADAIEQAPAYAAMAGDMVDELATTAKQRGVNLDERLQTTLALVERLTAPEMTMRLNQLLDLAETAPGYAAMLADMADGTIRGADIETRLRAALELADKLTNPEMTAKINQLLALADQAPGLIAMLGDMADDTFRQAQQRGINLEVLAQKGVHASVKFSELIESPEFDALLESGILDPQAVVSVGQAGRALAISTQQPVEPIGLFGLLGALRDPEMQKALGFLVRFGQNFGREIS